MFGKRFNILTIAGFKIGIDLSWFFIAILLSWSLAAFYFPYYYHGFSTGIYWAMGILGMLGLFVCVILHELSHAFVARYYGLPITHITLFIFGGVAEIKKEPPSPKVEFWMTIAGPIMSFLLAFLLFFLAKGGIHWGWPIPVTAVISYLALINFLLAIFNLLPAFPLDGGRIFRSILWGWKKNLSWATNVAASVGAGFGLALIILGIVILFMHSFLSGFWLIIIGWFLRQAAKATRSQFYVSQELEGEKVATYMKKDPISVPPSITIREFIDKYVYQTHHHLYPVTQSGELLGYISLKEVKTVPQANWDHTFVQQIMVPVTQFRTVTPDTHALEALNLLQLSESPTLLVVSNHHLVGILASQDLFKIISLKLELEEQLKK